MIPCNIDVYDYQVPDAGTGGRQEKGMTEDKLAGWHHQLDGHESEKTPGVSETPGVPRSMGSQRIGHDIETKQQTLPWKLKSYS